MQKKKKKKKKKWNKAFEILGHFQYKTNKKKKTKKKQKQKKKKNIFLISTQKHLLQNHIKLITTV